MKPLIEREYQYIKPSKATYRVTGQIVISNGKTFNIDLSVVASDETEALSNALEKVLDNNNETYNTDHR